MFHVKHLCYTRRMSKTPSPRQLLDFAIATEDNGLAALIIVTAGLDYLLLLQQQHTGEPLDIPARLSAISRIFDPQPAQVRVRA